MAYLVPRNHFKDTKLMFFYWPSMVHMIIDQKMILAIKNLKKKPRGSPKPLKIAKKLLQLHFWHNSVNFWLSGCSKSPQLRFLIDNQFWNFSFCQNFIFQNHDQSQTCWKFGGKKMCLWFCSLHGLFGAQEPL